MLKFYYNPLSPNARRVWITLLEKEIPFEAILLNLDGDQLQPDFLTVNPFHHIPVVVDDGFQIVESLAIMDYLESKYPTPAMLPTEPQALATVRMVQMVTANELFPQVISLIYENEDSPQFAQAKQNIDKVLQFFTQVLGDRSFFGSQQLTLADIVAGIAIHSLPPLGFHLSNYSKLNQWSERLMQRPVWQKTKLSAEDFEAFKRRVRILVKLRRREMNKGNQAK
ncbi:glutathione S-transferase family protein [Komarekiella sp. 'clone 1']|uniref:Glutathione S-transferase family protein n=1 Tax=Komarekiella delphini-convector SJRDD-AB1 TaxID=2593771 RepID=A0AA40VSD9_9NOST|nr:glutathione S-transferase family protein [Komarekiella delphini-convector]MBD6618057.1 glutathione S-transferase family protein [Komarekiella delphini-convector SJRDD-AB1]